MTLMPHQQAFVELSRERKRWALFAECRTRKTRAVLGAIEADPMRTVVVAPKTVARTAWMLDGALFPTLKVVLLSAELSASKRLAMIRGEWDVLVTNYELFKKYADELAAAARRLIVDESSKLKNPESAITKAAISVSAKMQSVYVMSGTPAPNDATEYWGQLRCIADPAKVKGSCLETYWKWAYRACSPVKRDVRGKQIIERWEQSPEQKAWVASVLAKCSTVWRREDIFGRETPNETFIHVELDAEAAVYAAAEDEYRLLVGEGEAKKIKAEAALIKLRQIVGGGVMADGECHDVGTSKLEALNDVLDEIGRRPTLVWFEFRGERERIAEMIEERGESCDWIDGETSWRAAEIAAAFQRGEITRLLCHPQAAGHGVTLHRAADVVYYSLSFSGELHTQSRDRVVNPDRADRVAYHYLVATLPGAASVIEEAEPRGVATVDHAMLRVLRGKIDKQSAMLAVLARRNS